MTRSLWLSGDHHALILPGAHALISGDVTYEEVLRVWDELGPIDSLDGLGSLLDVLSEVTGRGLRSLPDFAMAVLDEQGVHVAVRGVFGIEITQPDGSVVVMRGSEVSTWAERNFDGAAVAEVVLSSAADGTQWLPITGGVVPAGALRVVLAGVSTSTPEPAPGADVAALEPEAELEVVPEPDEPGEAPEPEPAVASAPETLIEADPEPEPPAPPAPSAAPGRFASLLSPHTVLHDIEDAAVRPDDPGADDPPAAVDEPVPAEGLEERVAPEPSAPSPEREPEPEPAMITPPSFISAVPSTLAPIRSIPASAAYAPAGVDDLEHHDGHTQLELPDGDELEGHLDRPDSAAQGETLLGVHCPAGHGNPTHRTVCRVCGQHLAGAGVRMPRPSLGWLHTSAGESIELVQNVLAGRDPRASRIQGTVMPRLLPLPHSHVSGTHLEIRLEGWSVLVADLRSTNGTFLQRPGQPTLRISEAPQLLMRDDVIQLGHGVDLRFEALP